MRKNSGLVATVSPTEAAIVPTRLHQTAPLHIFPQAQGVPVTYFIITHSDNIDLSGVKRGNCKESQIHVVILTCLGNENKETTRLNFDHHFRNL